MTLCVIPSADVDFWFAPHSAPPPVPKFVSSNILRFIVERPSGPGKLATNGAVEKFILILNRFHRHSIATRVNGILLPLESVVTYYLEDLIWSLNHATSRSKHACEIALENDALDVLTDLLVDLDLSHSIICNSLRALITIITGRPVREAQLALAKVVKRILIQGNHVASTLALDLLYLLIDGLDFSQWYIANYDGLVPLVLGIIEEGLDSELEEDPHLYEAFLSALDVVCDLVAPPRMIRREHFDLPRIASRRPPIDVMISSGSTMALVRVLSEIADPAVHEKVLPRFTLLWNGTSEVISRLLQQGIFAALLRGISKCPVHSTMTEMLGWILDSVTNATTADFLLILAQPYFWTFFPRAVLEFAFMDETPLCLQRVLDFGAEYGRSCYNSTPDSDAMNPWADYLYAKLGPFLESQADQEIMAATMLEMFETSRLGYRINNDADEG